VITVDFARLNLRGGMRVLDAGCGTGRHLAEAFRREGVAVVGLDRNGEDLVKAGNLMRLLEREREGGPWLVCRGDVTSLPFRDGAFDVVVCSEVLEHVRDADAAVRELVRVLKPGGSLAVSVPRFFPELVCWSLSRAYHEEEGGHVRIFTRRELLGLLEGAGTRCRHVSYRHALHSPYWWLRCLVGHKNDVALPVRLYRRLLEWDIVRGPAWVRMIDALLNPLIGKSIVLYLEKGS